MKQQRHPTINEAKLLIPFKLLNLQFQILDQLESTRRTQKHIKVTGFTLEKKKNIDLGVVCILSHIGKIKQNLFIFK
jgi:hypothetical protein